MIPAELKIELPKGKASLTILYAESDGQCRQWYSGFDFDLTKLCGGRSSVPLAEDGPSFDTKAEAIVDALTACIRVAELSTALTPRLGIELRQVISAMQEVRLKYRELVDADYPSDEFDPDEGRPSNPQPSQEVSHMARGKKNVMELPVQFGNVSFGDEIARIGLKFDAQVLSHTAAYDVLCGRRLNVTLIRTPAGEIDGQKSLPGMTDRNIELTSIADVKRYGVSLKNITAGLAFQIGPDVATLSLFAKRTGKLQILDVSEIPAEESGDEDDED